MEKFIIRGGKRLAGEISIAGSKNAVLPLLAATLLTREPCTITNVPDIVDVRNFLLLLKKLGVSVQRERDRIRVRSALLKTTALDPKLASSMRASVVLLGALLARAGRAASAYPGGDLIGARPIDVHLRAFRALGATVALGSGSIRLTAKKLKGTEVFADSSVTGTENIILAALSARGRSVIKLSAQEPHVVALCRFLSSMGAIIHGMGTHTLTIQGGARLRGAKTRVIPDMLEAGSFAILAAATASSLTLRGVEHDHMDAIYDKLSEMGVGFDKRGSTLIIHRPSKLSACTIRTGLYPNLATDLQPPFGVLATQATGVTKIHDWIWEGRLGYVSQLQRMGARIKVLDTHRALVSGPTRLYGARIKSLDIRSGITMVIAGLVASGTTTIEDIHHIDRGYERLEERLRAVGADIERLNN